MLQLLVGLLFTALLPTTATLSHDLHANSSSSELQAELAAEMADLLLLHELAAELNESESHDVELLAAVGTELLLADDDNEHELREFVVELLPAEGHAAVPAAEAAGAAATIAAALSAGSIRALPANVQLRPEPAVASGSAGEPAAAVVVELLPAEGHAIVSAAEAADVAAAIAAAHSAGSIRALPANVQLRVEPAAPTAGEPAAAAAAAADDAHVRMSPQKPTRELEFAVELLPAEGQTAVSAAEQATAAAAIAAAHSAGRLRTLPSNVQVSRGLQLQSRWSSPGAAVS